MNAETHTLRGPIQATARIVPPHLYWVLWRIALDGPLTSQEIAEDHNRPRSVQPSEYWSAQATSNRLRSLVRLGLIERDSRGFWLLTRQGRTWMATGAEV